jgi:hypothetical protein
MKSNAVKNNNFKCCDVSGKNCDFFEVGIKKCKHANIIGICMNEKAKENATEKEVAKRPIPSILNVNTTINPPKGDPKEGEIIEIKDDKGYVGPVYATGERAESGPYQGELCTYKAIDENGQKSTVLASEFWRYPGEKDWRK